MRTGSLICAAAMGLALAGPAPAMAEPDDVVDLPGLTVTVRKPDPTPVSGLTVTVHRPTPLSGVTVTAPKCPKARNPADAGVPPPQLVSSFPTNHSVVRPGLLVVRLTFDRPMTCDGMLDAHLTFFDPCPQPLSDPMISRDRRTFLTVCRVDEDKHYGLWLHLFRSLAGRPAKSSELVFATERGSRIGTVEEAIAQDPWLLQASAAQPDQVER
jgi:hypothetical protein